MSRSRPNEEGRVAYIEVSRGCEQNRMLDILFSPNKFFRERATNPGLIGPLLVVSLVAALGAAAAYPAAQTIAESLPPEAQGFGTATVAFSMIVALVGPFVVWALFAGVFHGLSGLLFDGEGSFRTTLTLTGWGFVPALVTAVVGVAVAFLIWPSVTLDFSDPARAEQAAQRIRDRPEFLVASVVGLIVLVWRGLLWTFAMQYGRNLSFREALITVGIPVVALLLWRVNGIVGVV